MLYPEGFPREATAIALGYVTREGFFCQTWQHKLSLCCLKVHIELEQIELNLWLTINRLQTTDCKEC